METVATREMEHKNFGKRQSYGMYNKLLLLLIGILCITSGRMSAQILDPTFVIGTGFDNEVRGFVQIAGGQIVVVGNFTDYNGTAINRIARLNLDGTIDLTFTPPAAGVINGQVNAIAVQPDNNLIIAGQFNGGGRNYVARLNADGTLDGTFTQTGTGLNGNANAAAIDGSGNIVVVGTFTNYNGTARNRLARLDNTGALDAGFTVGTGFVGGAGADAVTIDGSGNILVGGTFVSYNGTASSRIARITNTGAIDGTFMLGTGFNAVVNTITIDASNRIVVGGDFTTYNGTGRNRVVRLNNSGAIDGAFLVGTGFDGIVNSIVLEAGGKILVGGGFTTYNGTGRNNIARLNTNGSNDALFNPGNGFDNPVQRVLVQTDGKILVGGQFGTYNTTSARNRIARFGFASAAFVSGAIFPEAIANDGSVVVTRTVMLGPVGGGADVEEWTTGVANGANMTAGVHYNAANVPGGLTLQVQKTSNKVVTLSLTGNAAAHANANDVTNMQVTFLNAALEGNNAVGVENLVTTNYTVDFMDPAGAAYSATTYNESVANDGSVPTTRTITLSGGENWDAGVANGATFTAGVHFNVANVPAGLTAVITKNSATQVTISFTGNAAAHANANDVGNVQFTFLNVAVSSGNAAGVVGLNGVNNSINFNDPNNAVYSGTTFTEALANDGSVSTTRTITLTTETWNPGVANGTPLTNGVHYSVANVPAGLTMVLTKNSASVVTISFTGNALLHANAQDIATVQITFMNAAVNSGNVALTPSLNGVNLSIDFNDPAPAAAFSGLAFMESQTNNGTIATIITITLTTENWTAAVPIGGTFTPGVHYNLTNIPGNLVLTITKTSATTATLSFTGIASVHGSLNNVNNMGLSFMNASVLSGNAASVANLNGNTLSISYLDPVYGLFNVQHMYEYHVSNDGSVTDVIDITISGTTWVPAGAFTSGVDFTATNVPPGMTANVTRISPTVARVSLSGRASTHANVNTTTMTLTFLNGSVTNGNVSLVTGLSPRNIQVIFFDPTPPPPPPAPPVPPPPVPVITLLSSEFGQNGDIITIFGLNFTGVTEVRFGSTIARSFTVISPFEIRATVGTGSSGLVTVTNSFGTGDYTPFTYGAAPPPGPRITSIIPPTATFGETVTIIGQSLTGATEIRVGGIPVRTFTVENGNIIRFVVDSPAGGDVEVVVPGGIIRLGNGFTYTKLPPPTLTSADPSSLVSSDEESMVRLIGENLPNSGSIRVTSSRGGNATVKVENANPNRKEVVFFMPSTLSIPGTDTVRYVTPDGQISNPLTIPVKAAQLPKITSLTFLPAATSTSANGKAYSIQIEGVNFFKTATVSITGTMEPGKPVDNVTLRSRHISTGVLIAEVPQELNQDGGTYTLFVNNADGNSAEQRVKIGRRPAPAINGVKAEIRTKPNGEQEIVLIVEGEFFTDPKIEFNGVTLIISSWSKNQIVAVIPKEVAQNVNNSWIPPALLIINGDKQIIGARPAILIPMVGNPTPGAPEITSLKVLPSAATTSATCKSFTIEIIGRGFIPDSKVVLSGSDVTGKSWQNLPLPSIVKENLIHSEIPAMVNCEAGDYTITVYNNSALSDDAPLKITCGAEPVIITVQSLPVTGSGDPKIIIVGNNFDSPAVELLNAPLPVVQSNPTEILAILPLPIARKLNAGCGNPLIIVKNGDGKTDAKRVSFSLSLSALALTATTSKGDVGVITELQRSGASSWKNPASKAVQNQATEQPITTTVYPNPASDEIHISIPDGTNRTDLKVTIVDAKGKQYQNVMPKVQGGVLKQSVKELPQGTYTAIITIYQTTTHHSFSVVR